MHVLMVSTSYPRDASDWRGVFIRNIAAAIARQGIDIDLWAPPGDLPAGVRAATTTAEAQWLDHLMEQGGISHLMRQGGLSALAAPVQLLRMLRNAYRRQSGVDLYHINWLQSALPLKANAIPALITVLGNDLKLMRLPLIRNFLRRTMRRRRVAICPNAEWMQAPLNAAFGDVASVIPVSFGIDARWYAIKRAPSETLPLWIAVTRLTRDKLGPLFAWSESLFRGRARELHLFGPMQENLDVPDWVKYHGAASPQQLAEEWFPRATGLITLSTHAEGRPQVMLEAMAAGLPIVASRMPAHATLVFDDRTGMMCDSAETYARAITNLEDMPCNVRFSEAARAWCRERFGTWDDCARRYADVYKDLLGAAPA